MQNEYRLVTRTLRDGKTSTALHRVFLANGKISWFMPSPEILSGDDRQSLADIVGGFMRACALREAPLKFEDLILLNEAWLAATGCRRNASI